ncbi:recombinase family protein [Paraclostridium sordellii]|uniref:recombinase family protein n=1 Tax=Paraclostridium sordellii TaxID=1505 RepID=UPI0005E25CFD|nr:recombinase family protein [Paeniclostridium sordellii]MDU6247328.1 recombinase family protein [Paeniclostridium sordellii]CEO27078.1 Site-specific recombinase [[Clostridium] sordellii] [Paeniclostridium sordellii]CEP42910.1 Site-specific recombinase [[Clostridium] sordellii] [Paeniclostridium sordellii]
MIKTCIYLRKSRSDEECEKQGEFETLSRHRSTLLKLAKEQNLDIIEIKEELVSGESISYRPKMIELLDEVKNGLYDSVLVMDIDRLGRGNMQDQGLILETFKKSNTKIITPRKTYDLNNEWDEEYSEFEAFMARKELKLINRRMQRGRVKSVEEGKFIASKPPYGYKFIFDESGKKSMIIDNDKAEVIKMIFDLYVNKHYGGVKISSHLNSLGLKTSTGRTWYPKVVRDILKNKTYAGYVVWNKVDRGKNNSRTRPVDEHIEAKGIHEPIIDESIFIEAQNLFKNSSIPSTKKNTSITNPLAGLIICSECGHKMIAQQSTYKNNELVKFLKCLNCGKNRGSKLSIVEKEIINELENWIASYQVSIKNLESPKNNNSNLESYYSIIKSLDCEYKTLLKQKENLHNLLEQDIYDVDTYLDRSKVLADKIDLNRDNLTQAKKDLKKEKESNFSISDILPQVENVLELYYQSNNMQERNDLLKEVIDYIEYSRESKKRLSKFNIKIYPRLRYNK